MVTVTDTATEPASDRGRADAAIVLEHISKRFGPTVAASDVCLTIHRGEFVSLLGPSGCGKTTVLRIIAGFETQDRGRVRVHGQPVDGLPPNRRKVNTVFQRYALFPHMTVADNLAFPLKVAGVDKTTRRQRVLSMLELVQLPSMHDADVATLSGGQAQRVALARALIGRPGVLLLDEPLAALDLKLRKAMQLELRRIQEEVGVTFFYVTHDQEEALTMSDRIVLMKEGRIVQAGAPEQIYERPTSVFASHFIGESNLLEGTVVEGAPGEALSISLGDGDIIATSANPHPIGERVTVSVRPERIRLRPNGQAQAEDNMLEGMIERRVYLGHIVRWLIRVGPDTSVTVETPATTATGLRAGDAVVCTWDSSDAIVLPPDRDPPLEGR